jgi:hypothetical protein
MQQHVQSASVAHQDIQQQFRLQFRQHYRPSTQQAPRWLRRLWLWF